MPVNGKTNVESSSNPDSDSKTSDNSEALESEPSGKSKGNGASLPNGFMSPFRSKSDSIFQFPTLVDGQMTFSGIPVHPIAAALGQPIPADQVSSVASQLTSHMSSVASPLTLLTPKLVASSTNTTNATIS